MPKTSRLLHAARHRNLRVPGLTVVALGAWLSAGEARAEGFRYVDREGRVHEIPTQTAELAGQAPPATPAAPVLLNFPASRLDPEATALYTALAREAADHYSLPPELVIAVMRVESGFNPRAVSRTGAMGLMQLMPATAVELGVMNPFDPRQNAFAGARYLRTLLNMFDGSVSLALAAYNAGSGAVRRAGGIPPIQETQRYVAAVLSLYRPVPPPRPVVAAR